MREMRPHRRPVNICEMRTALALITAPAAWRHVRYVAPVRRSAARDVVAEVYRQVERDFGMLAPPVSLHSPVPEILVAAWAVLRETLLRGEHTTRREREAVAVAASAANSCQYCAQVHGTTLTGLSRLDSDPPVGEDMLTAAAPDRAAELIGVAVTFHYLNRMVNVFLQESLLPNGIPAAVAHRALAVAAPVLARLARRRVSAGGLGGLLGKAVPAHQRQATDLPPDLAWADGSARIAGVFRQAAAVFTQAGRQAVAPAIRDLVLTRLAEPRRTPGIGEQPWWDADIARLPESDRPAGRLALLTAVASHRVTAATIQDFQRHRPGDRPLLQLTSWASMAAARQAGLLLFTSGTVTPQTMTPQTIRT